MTLPKLGNRVWAPASFTRRLRRGTSPVAQRGVAIPLDLNIRLSKDAAQALGVERLKSPRRFAGGVGRRGRNPTRVKPDGGKGATGKYRVRLGERGVRGHGVGLRYSGIDDICLNCDANSSNDICGSL